MILCLKESISVNVNRPIQNLVAPYKIVMLTSQFQDWQPVMLILVLVLVLVLILVLASLVLVLLLARPCRFGPCPCPCSCPCPCRYDSLTNPIP